MAKITIEELYRGEKYDIMSAVTVKAMTLGIDERTEDGRTWIEMELVRQTIVAMLKLNQSGDCISDKELGDAVAVSVSKPIVADIEDEEFGAILTCAVRYCLGRRSYMPGLIIGYITPLLPYISDNALRCIEADLSKPDLHGGFGDEKIDKPIWIKFRNNVQGEIQKRKESCDESN